MTAKKSHKVKKLNPRQKVFHFYHSQYNVTQPVPALRVFVLISSISLDRQKVDLNKISSFCPDFRERKIF